MLWSIIIRCFINANCLLVMSAYDHSSTALTVYPKKYAHGFCFAVLCCGYTLTDFPISIRLTSLALWQSNDCPSASKVILMNMEKYFMWIHYERLHNHNKAKHNKTVRIFLGIYCKDGFYGPKRHGMEMHSVLLALCEGNARVTSEFPAQQVSDAVICCFLLCQPYIGC